MLNRTYKKEKKQIKRYILLGIIFINILGILFHFLYEFSGNMTLVGLISPVNESVWEHLKIAFFPTLIWWLLTYFIIGKKQQLSFGPWFVSCVISQFISSCFIIIFYYTYTGAFGFHSTVLDIASLSIGIILGQWIALRVYQHGNLPYYCYLLLILLFFGLLVGFILFTFQPPHFPLFYDMSKGIYGIP